MCFFVFVWGKGLTLLSCLCISSCPKTICWKEYSFLIECSLHPYWKSVYYKCKGLVLDTTSKFYLCAHKTLSDYCLFVLCFETMKCEYSTPISFFFKIVLDILGPCYIHVNFRISMALSTQKCTGILNRTAPNL